MLFDAQVTSRDGWAIVAFTGELDLASAPEARHALIRALGADTTRLIVDLSRLEFLDSFGLGVVVSALKRVGERSGELVIVTTEPRVSRPFELSGLDQLIPIHPSVEAVLAGRVTGG